MDIILTHERTDFDGLASLLGAHLLDKSLIPVLPRKLNRNVEAFLVLYGIELPFVDPRDLEDGPIDSVCLVDTQGLTSIRGMTADTEIKVIDHHKIKPDVPGDWETTIKETGATTTIFVEVIQEQGIPLTPIQATLLLLGIYEDTGSLTYTRTTPADIFAAGYLLEYGASLSIVADYINHPLSLEQQKLYEELRANAESRIIHGHVVIIAQADARDLDEELSTLAHKLRDLLDPDAIFLLLTTSGGVQVIARSTDDHIDVSAVLSTFEGGGGHPRAAAAMIKDGDPGDIYRRLDQALPDYVQPAVTAKKLMSREPQTLSPDTPVKEAADLMVKYGYEGYPVVDEGEIVGLLTRRAVDRAQAHGLNLTASQLMEAGNVRVFPSDSLEHIQNVMTETGWGQIPVVTPRSKKIVGIVTRTDLLKILAPSKPTPGRQNLAPRLENKLSPGRLVLLSRVADLAHQQGDALYIVGGFVRDLLLDYPSLDFDLVVEGDAIALAESLQKQFGGRINSHERFGTAKWFVGSDTLQQLEIPEGEREDFLSTLDFISARTEFYTHPTALPTVERGSIKLDLHRRDFTINTLALRLDGHHYGELYDYWGGLSDLKAETIRVLHSLSFVDDPTRILRAVRYEQRYEFEIESRTQELMLQAKGMLNRVSGDRLRHELDRIFEEDRAPEMMRRLQDLTILAAIHPGLTWDERLDHLFQTLPDKQPHREWQIPAEVGSFTLHQALLYLMWLKRVDQVEKAADRLKLPREIARSVREAAELHQELERLADLPPSAAADYLERISNLAVYAVYLDLERPDLKRTLSRYLSSWQHVQPRTTGIDLRDRGLPPGPRYSEILSILKNAWLDGKISTAKEEGELLDALISQNEGEERVD
ncbi:MAG: CBS domain-containing protein [Anaerolineales bacterium]|nr:CBS domain-containing protein [Anaerolineales bacterium]